MSARLRLLNGSVGSILLACNESGGERAREKMSDCLVILMEWVSQTMEVKQCTRRRDLGAKENEE